MSVKVLNKKQPRYFDLDSFNYKSYGYREMTEEELLTVNGGAEIENSIAAQANANVGDTVTRKDGTTWTITQGDINWAQQIMEQRSTTYGATGETGQPQYGNGGPSGNNDTTPKNPPPLINQDKKETTRKEEAFVEYVMKEDGAGGFGHGAILVHLGEKYYLFEINSIPEDLNLNDNLQVILDKMKKYDKENYFHKSTQPEYESKVLSKTKTKFPTWGSLETSNRSEDKYSGCIQRTFDSRKDVMKFLEQAGYDSGVKFDTTDEQTELVYKNAIENGSNFTDYILFGNNCGSYSLDSLVSPGTGIYHEQWETFGIVDFVPNNIGKILLKSNPSAKTEIIPLPALNRYRVF